MNICVLHNARQKWGMAQTNTQRQQHFIARQINAGARRLNVYVSGAAMRSIDQIATRDNMSRRAVIERLALTNEPTINQRKDR
jgi:ribosomal protein L28